MDKSKETKPTTSIALFKGSTLHDHYPQELKSPFFKNCFLWSKSCCKIFTFRGTFFKEKLNLTATLCQMILFAFLLLFCL
jgi:hypothetical protein